ncbi:hypothetical protein K458DRAFT_415743 [Lentithecium fluviatile CBS 122367]|uniref:Zn(2)-C6 fungal-type domain-containing protein n=1 Tax=Lentithecium fluviatile CBS 122367 TaxID=1168545 RepID=A0A6G1JAB9_9PLEO|nr:hypothetical protein K458DRAFT_415743 [Lentithecium fluviatile CBS 122367]
MSARIARKRETKACTVCAKAKVKCETAGPGDRCKRCQRLGKVCGDQTPGAHSNKRSLESQYSKADLLRLESKLDSVSQVLAASSQTPYITRPSSSPPPNSSPGVDPENVLPNSHEASSLLSLFCTEMAPLFPFVSIPRNVTSDQLRTEKPILFTSIMMVASQNNVHRQSNLAQVVRYELSQAVLVRGEKSLALLQSILIYLAWNHVHLQLGAQLLNLLHLAVSMLTELGLNKESHAWSNTGAGAVGDLGRHRMVEATRTLEERRAVLGVFWLSSITKTCLKDMDSAAKFARYMEKFCQMLEVAQDQPSDAYLVQLVRLQQKADTIGEVIYDEELEYLSSMNAPLAIGIQSLEKEIFGMEPTLRALPLELAQTSLLQISYQSLNLYLHKIALDDRLFPTTYTMLRTNLLASSLSAIESLVSLFFSISPQTILTMPYPTWAQIGHAMLVLHRLSEVQHGTWDRAYVSSVLDPRETFRRVARRLEEVMTLGMAESPPRHLPEIFTMLVARLKELGEIGMREPGAEDVDVEGASASAIFEDDTMSNFFFDFLDLGQAY